MSLIKLYFASDKQKKDRNFILNMNDAKHALILQSCIFTIFAFLAYFISEFSIYMVLPICFGIYNIVFVYLNIKNFEYQAEKIIPKLMIKFYSDLFLYHQKELEDALAEKNSKPGDIANWTLYYAKMYKSDLSLRNFKDVVNKMEIQLSSINGKTYELNDREFRKFRKKAINPYKEKYFPEIDDLIKNNKINIRSSENTNVRSSIFTNDAMAKNLKTLGLSASTRNMKIINTRYYELVKMYHPDSNRDTSSQEKLAEINKAYTEIKKIISSSGY